MATFMEMMEAQWAQGKHLCIGLDPIFEKIPELLRRYALVQKTREDLAFALGNAMADIIDQTYHLTAAYKPNSAFFERYGQYGFRALERVVEHAKSKGVPVILDAKRGDIGVTNEHYAVMAFSTLEADAITIHPYLGWEANKPFLDRFDKGIFVLCRTSNSGADEFQDLKCQYPQKTIDGGMTLLDATPNPRELYQRIAENVSDPKTWNQNKNCGLVTGATYPEEIREVRRIAPDVPLLIPGVGTQGGDLEESVKAARHRFLINSSSGIIFADDPKQKAEELDGQIRHVLTLIEERKER